MDLTIHDLTTSKLSKFEVPELEPYTKIFKPSRPVYDTVEVVITVRFAIVGPDYLVIQLPNGNMHSVNLLNCDYLKMEVY